MPILVVIAALVVALMIWRRGRSTRPVALPAGYAHGAPAVARGSVLALARFEAPRLLLHPAFLFGVVITPFILWLATGQETPTEWWQADLGIVLGVVPLGWMTIVAANLNALRARRHGTEELLESTPVPAVARTAAHAVSSLATVPVAVTAIVGWTLVVAYGLDARGTPRLAELAAGLFIVGGAVVVGVVVARWLPHPVFGVAAVIVVSVLQGVIGDRPDTPMKFLAFGAPSTDAGDPLFDVRHAGWHLVYLAGLTLLIAVIALLRHGWRRPLGIALAAAIVTTGVSGYFETRPADGAQVAAMVDYVTRPAAHQVCEERDTVTYCAYRRTADDAREWHRPVEGVLTAVPEDVATRPLDVRQRFETIIGNSDCGPDDFLDTLPDNAAARLTYEQVFPKDDAVHPGPDTFSCSESSVRGLFLAIQVGAWAVGLPPSPWHHDVRCRADGQARSVIALWLGAQRTPEAKDTLDRLIADEGARTSTHFDFPDDRDLVNWDGPPMWGVEWHVDDVVAAREILDRPRDDIESVLAERWGELVDPATPVSVLLVALRVEGDGAALTAPTEEGACA